MQKLESYSGYQFSLTRIIVGIYLFLHFVFLIPYAKELFSNEGVLSEPSLNFTYPFFPNILFIFDTPMFVTIFLMLLTFLSIVLMIGYKRRLVSLILWYGFACLFNRNNLINNPRLAFVGWILLVFTCLPSGEPLSADEEDCNWFMPKELFCGAWIIMGLSYSISGYHKLGSPGWMNGDALRYLTEGPLARNYFFPDFILKLPDWIIHPMTWSVLGLEVLFLPFILFKWGRITVWTLMVGMHLGILTLVDFADLTMGVLMIHVFTFDTAWFKEKNIEAKEKIVFFDGVCGLCDSFISFLFKEDKNKIFKVATLQGEMSKKLLEDKDWLHLNSIIYYEDGKTYRESEAVFRIFSQLPGLWRVLSFAVYLPRIIRNTAYNLIAKNRYLLFGKNDSCRIPTVEERARFLN
jgi:predicted DCC family thiol-disulfide oxidoreductase YuxK